MPGKGCISNQGDFMEVAVDRVMQAYGMMVNITFAQEKTLRADVTGFLSASPSTDENQLAIEGLRYLRAK